MKSHQHINADSGIVEYYTPIEIIEAARRTMGGIDLDPASSANANEIVRATRFYGIADDGLAQPWFGRVWMNHPFNKAWNRDWISNLIRAHNEGDMEQGCCITFASTSEAWFRPLLAFPQCFLHKRTNYRLPDGTIKKGATKGSVVTYLGPDVQRFASEFRTLGTVKVAI